MFNKNNNLSSSSNVYNGTLDVLKLIFTIPIFMYHFVVQWEPSTLKIFFSGSTAVEFYFIISGYLMAVSASKVTVKDENLGKASLTFVFKKLKAVFPYYIFTYFVSFVVYCETKLGDCENILDYVERFFKMLPNFLLLDPTGIESVRPIDSTWYIGAMLISMLFIYPLIIKFRDIFLNVVAPLTSIILMGFLSQKYDILIALAKLVDNSFVTASLLRAILSLCVGCCVFAASERFKKIQFTNLIKNILAVISTSIYIFAFFAMACMNKDIAFPLIILLFFALTITVSRQSAFTTIFDNKISKWFGKLSLAIYLSQSAPKRWLIYAASDLSLKETFLLYVLYTVISTAACMIIMDSLCYLYEKHKIKIKSIFINQN